jgi:hypothetical protein
VGDHHLGIVAVMMKAGESLVLTADEIATSAGSTVSAVTAEEADADSLAEFPADDGGAHHLDHADHFVAGHSGRPARGRGSRP